MKNKIILILAALTIIAITGCVPQQGIEDIDIRTGTEGLTIEFLERAPPADAYEGSTAKAILRMTNLGAEDIENGIVRFGLEKGYLSIEGEPFEEINVAGKETDIAGGIELIERDVFLGSLDPQMETLTTTMTATACYPYKTIASPMVCVDTDIYSLKEQEKSCTPSEVALSGGQGGPVSVVNVVPKMVPSKDNPKIIKPQFEIFIQNAGRGQAVNSEKYIDACRGEPISVNDWNSFDVSAKFITGVGTEYLNCSPKRSGMTSGPGYLHLKEGSEFIRCTYEKGISTAMGTYSTPLIIEIDYGYVESISRNILIRKEAR